MIFDASRAVENAWFIQQRETGWGDRGIAEIKRAMCDLTGGATVSAKKDSFVNIGGWLGLRDPELAARARSLVVASRPYNSRDWLPSFAIVRSCNRDDGSIASSGRT